MASDRSFEGFQPKGVTRRRPARKKPKRGTSFSPRELDRQESERTIERAHAQAMLTATRLVKLDGGVVWFDAWAKVARTQLTGFTVREGELVRGFVSIFGLQLQERLIQLYSRFGKVTAENVWVGSRACVRAYLRVPISKLGLVNDDAKSRRYFDES